MNCLQNSLTKLCLQPPVEDKWDISFHRNRSPNQTSSERLWKAVILSKKSKRECQMLEKKNKITKHSGATNSWIMGFKMQQIIPDWNKLPTAKTPAPLPRMKNAIQSPWFCKRKCLHLRNFTMKSQKLLTGVKLLVCASVCRIRVYGRKQQGKYLEVIIQISLW